MLATQYLNANMRVTIKPAVPNSAQKIASIYYYLQGFNPKNLENL